MRNFNLPTAVALTCVLAAGCAESPPPTVYVPDQDKEIILQAADQAKNYWTDQGLGQVAAAKVVFVERNQKFACGNEAPTTNKEPDAIRYCRNPQAVIFNQVTLLDELPDSPAEAKRVKEPLYRNITYHEYGHAAQQAMGIASPKLGDVAGKLVLENQADCFAGMLAAKYSPSDHDTMKDFYMAKATRDTHGTGQVRWDSYNQGFDTGKCELKKPDIQSNVSPTH